MFEVKAPEDPVEADEDDTDRLKNDPQLQKAVEVMRENLASKHAAARRPSESWCWGQGAPVKR